MRYMFLRFHKFKYLIYLSSHILYLRCIKLKKVVLMKLNFSRYRHICIKLVVQKYYKKMIYANFST